MILADEINRTPPKTQAALLEAMQEHQVTAAGRRYPLEEPFFVLATQNPIEMEGTYPLPEAQLDRFMFNVVIDYLPEDDEVAVVQRTTSGRPASDRCRCFTGEDVLRFHEVVRKVPIATDVVDYAVRLAAASRPKQCGGGRLREPVGELGRRHARVAESSCSGRKRARCWPVAAHVSIEDIRALATPVLRHRMLVNYRAEAEGVQVEDVIRRLIEHVKARDRDRSRRCVLPR